MEKQLQLLLLEDDMQDAGLIQKMLERSGMLFNARVVSDKTEFANAISSSRFDVILADHSLPQFSSVDALEMVLDRQLYTPFILVTGTVSEEFAVNILQKGADNYILKNNLQRLPSAIHHAIEKKRIREEKEIADRTLRKSERKYRLLFKKNPMPMWVESRTTLGIIAVNEAAIAHYGYSAEEFQQIGLKDLVPAEDEDKYISLAHKSFTGIHHAGVWKHIKKNGESLFADMIVTDFNTESGPARLLSAHDITEKLKAQENLIQSNQEIRRLVSHLQVIREEERTIIAREIHDELGQMLTVLKINMSMMRSRIPGDENELREEMNNTIRMTDEISNTVRQIASKLRPGILDDMGLAAALEWQSREFMKRTGISCNFTEEHTDTTLDRDMATGLFRIYQETLTNIAKHSEATEVDALLRFTDGHLVLIITDNGNGFDPAAVKAKKTLGLLGMKERAALMNASLVVDSLPGKGCSVTVKLKL